MSGAWFIGVTPVFGHPQNMDWKTIRLELGRTPDFPLGSVTRAYLVRLPLTANGKIVESGCFLPSEASYGEAILAMRRETRTQQHWRLLLT